MSVSADVELERSLRDTMAGSAEATEGSVPVIDISADGASDAMWAAATNVGFFTIVNHGIDEALIDECFAISEQFFARELAAKQSASPFAPALNSGYEFMTQVRPSTGVL